MVPSEMKGQVANWQRAERSLARPFTNHPGPSHGASAMKEEYDSDIIYYLHFKPFLHQESRREFIRGLQNSQTSVLKSVTFQMSSVTGHLSWTVAMFSVCDLHDCHATGQPHIISLADILLAKSKKWFQRKTLKWGILIMPQQYHSFWLPKWKSDPITDQRIRWHLK